MLYGIGKRLIALGLPIPLKPFTKFMEWSLLRQTLLALRVNCVLDVGASKGQFAINLRRIGYKGHIVSFEPIRDDFALMESAFQQDRHWSGHNIALGSEDGVRAFQVAEESHEMSSFHDTLDPKRRVRTEPVTIRKLDSVFEEVLEPVPAPRRIFLKMDTQGHDVEVVRGAARVLPAISGLQSELAITPLYKGIPSYLEALACYEQNGFRLVDLVEAARADGMRLAEMNCLMVRDPEETSEDLTGLTRSEDDLTRSEDL